MGLASKIFEDTYVETVKVDRPDVTAITSDMAKSYARIDFSIDDDIVDLLIESAQRGFEKFTSSPLYQSEVVAEVSADRSGNVKFQVPLKPIVSIDTVQQDGDDIDYEQEGNWIVIDNLDADCVVTITYTAGLHEENDTVDSAIREGLLKYITSNYNDREDVADFDANEMPNGSKSKWKPFKYMRF